MNLPLSDQLDQSLSTSLYELSTVFLAFLPQLFWALLVLVIGIVIGHWAKSLTQKALGSVNLAPILKRFGISQVTTEGDMRPQFERIVAETIRWIIIYIFLISVFSILGISSIAEIMQNLLGFLPNIITATLIFLLSILLAGFAESFVKNAFSLVDVVTSRLMGKIASYTVVIIGSLIALSELGIAEYFINILFIGFVLTLSLTLGLAFGLGSKDLVSKLLTERYDRYIKTHSKSKKSST